MPERTLRILLLLSVLPALQSFTIPGNAPVLAGYDMESVKERQAQTIAGRLEGLWYYPDEHITLAIERMENEKGYYRLVAIETEDCAVDCGCVLGYMEESAENDKLRLWLYSGIAGDTLTRPVECVANVENGGNNITIDKPKIKMRLSMNIAQFFPTIFGRIRIYPRLEKPEIKPGFIKLDNKKSDTPTYF